MGREWIKLARVTFHFSQQGAALVAEIVAAGLREHRIINQGDAP